jgi:hypothetical protein
LDSEQKICLSFWLNTECQDLKKDNNVTLAYIILFFWFLENLLIKNSGCANVIHVLRGNARCHVFATREWLRGNAERPALIDKEDSPMWNRAFSAPADRPITPSNARKLENVLYAMGASRMIVGHTPQAGGINSFVTEQGYEVWRTDTGMSRWVKNGPLECLEILADGTARVLTRTGVVPGAVRRMEENAEPQKTKRANSGAGERGFVQGSTST